jgi:ribonuclease BN (tRNA processing enzyme)
VKIQLLPSSVSGEADRSNQYLTSFIINDVVAIDAGSLGLFGSPHQQSRIKHVLLSHSHIDHIAALPIFLENAYSGSRDCVTIHGSSFVLDCLQKDIFNDRVWPDFIRLSSDDSPILKLATLEAFQGLELEGLRITPVPVDHLVPTLGFVIEDGNSAVVVVSDTGPTDRIWQHASRAPNLKAVFLEAKFPNSMAGMAATAKHLTPALFAREAVKLKRPATLIAVHINARFRDEIVRELRALNLVNLEICDSGKVYLF